MYHAVRVCLSLACMLLVSPGGAAEMQDPLRSPGWKIIEQRFFQDQVVVFDERVRVMAPPAAEDTFAVPAFVRVEGIDDIRRLLVISDLNPIQRILEMELTEQVRPAVGFRFKVQQRTPIRAAVQTGDGTWYLGGTWVDAAGGGCTAPSVASADPEWQERLGEIRAGLWPDGEGGQRLKFHLMHPMDTGLVNNIPRFHLETLDLLNGDGELLAAISIDPAMAENPQLTLEFAGQGTVHLRGRDNQGNRFAAMVTP